MIIIGSRAGANICAGLALALAASLLTITISAGADNPAASYGAIYTADAAARQTGGAADRLLQSARTKGELRVIVGLRTVMRMEHTLGEAQVTKQRAALNQIQDAVAKRAAVHAAKVDRFDFIPYMSLFVNAAQLARLLNDPQVVSIQEDVPMQASSPPLAPAAAAKAAASASISTIHADDVWAEGITGNGWVVAVLDNGVNKTHPMLKNKVLSEACYSTNLNAPLITSMCPGGAKSSIAPGSAGLQCPKTAPLCVLGTHIASIAAGQLPLLKGVAKDAKIIAIQVFSNSGADKLHAVSFTTDQIKGLQRVYALRNQFKIAAVNLALTTSATTDGQLTCDNQFPAYRDAVANLWGVGIVTVSAAGNEGSNVGVSLPACISNVVAVGFTQQNDQLAKLSNHSEKIALLAPGTNIEGAGTGGSLLDLTGSSQASAHVSGAFALLKQAWPAANFYHIMDALNCTGKMVGQRFVSATSSPEINPPQPRIDLIGAYNFMMHSPNVVRNWLFTDATDATDWSPFRGGWELQNGNYGQKPRIEGWTAAFTANCNTRLSVTARVKRSESNIDPPKSKEAAYYYNSGLFLKAKLNYTTEIMSGYYIAYNNLPDPVTNVAGQAVMYRFTNANLVTARGTVLALCAKHVPVNVGNYNTIQVVSNGASHTYSLNGKEVCTVNDALYKSGAVGVTAAFPAGVSGHQFLVDSLKIQSLGGGSPHPGASTTTMDPAAMALPGVTGDLPMAAAARR